VAEFVHERDAERVAGIFYGLTLMALSLAVTAFVRYAAEHRRLVRDEVEAHEVQAALAHQPSFLLYGIGIAVSVFFPTVGVALYLLTALYLGIPGRTIHRLLLAPLARFSAQGPLTSRGHVSPGGRTASASRSSQQSGLRPRRIAQIVTLSSRRPRLPRPGPRVSPSWIRPSSGR
jgi:hypothetical protein